MTRETDLRLWPQARSATRLEMQRTRRWTTLIQRHWDPMGGWLVTSANIIGGKMKHINFPQSQQWHVALSPLWPQNGFGLHSCKNPTSKNQKECLDIVYFICHWWKSAGILLQRQQKKTELLFKCQEWWRFSGFHYWPLLFSLLTGKSRKGRELERDSSLQIDTLAIHGYFNAELMVFSDQRNCCVVSQSERIKWSATRILAMSMTTIDLYYSDSERNILHLCETPERPNTLGKELQPCCNYTEGQGGIFSTLLQFSHKHESSFFFLQSEHLT